MSVAPCDDDAVQSSPTIELTAERPATSVDHTPRAERLAMAQKPERGLPAEERAAAEEAEERAAAEEEAEWVPRPAGKIR